MQKECDEAWSPFVYGSRAKKTAEGLYRAQRPQSRWYTWGKCTNFTEYGFHHSRSKHPSFRKPIWARKIKHDSVSLCTNQLPGSPMSLSSHSSNNWISGCQSRLPDSWLSEQHSQLGEDNRQSVGSRRTELRQEAQTLLNKKPVVKVPATQSDNGFYSTFFLVPKKAGQQRSVRPFNKFIEASRYTHWGLGLGRLDDMVQP